MTDPLSYLELLSLNDSALLALTDSGGIQEETTVLGVPCVTLRENTERPITVTSGTNQVAGTQPESILRAILRARTMGNNPRIPPLWDGRAAERIVEVFAGMAT
jgi:UDP-N-acetylglucosamine 2-epimerase (non-hydrolysing)